jgi:hypothetical protein
MVTAIRKAMRQKQSRNTFGWMIAGGVVRLRPSNDPKSKRGSGANPRFPANEIGVPLKYFLVPTVFSQAPRKFFCKKMQRRCSEIVPLDQTNILDEGRLLPRRLQ